MFNKHIPTGVAAGLAAFSFLVGLWVASGGRIGTDVRADPPAPSGWLVGPGEEKFAAVERHLRGLDVSMAEIGHRYGELLIAGKERNWEYASYQAEKIDLSLRLAVERRPKRAQSARPFLAEDLPAVLAAAKAKDEVKLDAALGRLHAGCVECHKKENVLYFKSAVDRIKLSASR